MRFEEKILMEAPAEKVFSLYADVPGWSSWDPDVTSASVSGSFTTGALRPPEGPKVKITFTEVAPGRSFTIEGSLPLCVMRFEHELLPMTGKNQAVHRASFSGLLSPLFGRLAGSRIRAGLPRTLKGLKRAAERSG